MPNQYYTYLYLREDGTPYYVGKGCKDRAYRLHHKGLHLPKDKSLILIQPRANEQEAFDTEIELIRNWGRKDNGTGCLYNRTDGGDNPPRPKKGQYQPPRSEETKLKMSKAALRYAKSRGNNRGTGWKQSEECKAKIALSHTGMKASEEAKLKMSISAKNRWKAV